MAEKTLEHQPTGIVGAFDTFEHDVTGAFRVGEVLAKGAWDYSVHNPAEMAKTTAVTVGTGLLVGAAMALFPESRAVGALVGIGGGALGAVGLTSMGIQTYHSFKNAWPDLQIVADADHHSSEEVRAASKAAESKVGGAVANIAMLLPGFVIGNVAGNLGADAIMAAKGTDIAAAAAAGTTGAIAAEASCPLAAVEGTASVAERAALCSGTVPDLAEVSPVQAAWRFMSYNPLAKVPRPTFWMRLNNNDAFAFESNYWLERSDIDALKFAPVGPSVGGREIRTRPSQDKKDG